MLVAQNTIYLGTNLGYEHFKMMVTGILLFLLGTKIDLNSAVEAEVKYGPSQISIKEHIDQSPVVLPAPGSANFIHQGSNYFFGTPFKPSEVLPLPPPGRVDVVEEKLTFSQPSAEKVIQGKNICCKPQGEKIIEEEILLTNPRFKEVIEEEIILSKPRFREVIEEKIILSNPHGGKIIEEEIFSKPYVKEVQEEETILSKPHIGEVIEEEIILSNPHGGKIKDKGIFLSEPHVEQVNPLYTNSLITVDGKNVIYFPKLEPVPNITLNIPPGFSWPPYINSQLLSKLDIQSVMSGLPNSAIAPFLSQLIERPVKVADEFVVSEVEVREIPPPPELPPLNLDEIFGAFTVENKNIILVPPPPAAEAVLPPSIILPNQPCPPSLCARNIVLERILPNIACEKSNKVELISIPASLQQPVVTTSFLPYIIKH